MANLSDKDKEQVEAVTKAIAGLDLMGIDSNLQIKIEDMEKELTFRRFYFPGCDHRLRISGKGTSTDSVLYVQDGLTSFDPRYIEQYNKIANNYDFFQWMLYYDPSTSKIRQMNFGDALNNFILFYDNAGRMNQYKNTETNYEIMCSTFASLKYFDKMACFKEYVKDNSTDASATVIKTGGFDKFMSNNATKIQSFVKHIADFTGQSERSFKEKDIGYFAPEELAFGLDSHWFEIWSTYDKQYKEYKEKLWNLLSGIQNLQLCVNRDNSIQQVADGGQLTLTQMNNCVQTIQNIDYGSSNKDNDNTPSGTKTVNGESVDPVTDNVNYDVSGMIDDMKRVSNAESEIRYLNKQMKTTFVVICVIALMFIGVTILYCFKLRSAKRNSSYTMSNVIETH